MEERLRSDPMAAALVDELRSLSSAIKSLPRETLSRDLRVGVLAEVEQAQADSDAARASDVAADARRSLGRDSSRVGVVGAGHCGDRVDCDLSARRTVRKTNAISRGPKSDRRRRPRPTRNWNSWSGGCGRQLAPVKHLRWISWRRRTTAPSLRRCRRAARIDGRRRR